MCLMTYFLKAQYSSEAMISHKHKFIFIHIAKCGGCSIANLTHSNAFQDKGVFTGHWPLAKIYDKYPESKGYFTFTFVRNPWSRLVSGYSMWKNMGSDHKWYKYDKVEIDLCNSNSFKNFLYAIKTGFIKHKPHIHPYIGHYFNQPSDIDFIGKIENFQEDFEIVCDKIEIAQQQLPHSNKSKHEHYTEYYDDETREIVAERYSKDIEYFGYEFGE